MLLIGNLNGKLFRLATACFSLTIQQDDDGLHVTFSSNNLVKYLTVEGVVEGTLGGEFSNTDFAKQLKVHRSMPTNYDAVITYSNNGGILGYIGMNGSSSPYPYYRTAEGTDYRIWHDGYHPTTMSGYGIADGVSTPQLKLFQGPHRLEA